MLSRTVVLLVAASAALGVVVLASQAGAARAGTTTSAFTDRKASAQFVSDVRGLHTSVDITLNETERTTADGIERHLSASIGIFQSDSRRPKAQPVDLAGSVEGEPGALQINGDLSEALAEITVPVCGAKVLHSGRLKARPVAECVDAKVDVRWTGTGELVIAGGPSDMPAAGCTEHRESTSQRRLASAEGAARPGSVTLAPNASTNA